MTNPTPIPLGGGHTSGTAFTRTPSKTDPAVGEAYTEYPVAPPRCEPQGEWRERQHWAWLWNGGAGSLICSEWVPCGLWDSAPMGGGGATSEQRAQWGWRYVSPVPSPSDLAALVRAGNGIIAAVDNMDRIPHELPVVNVNKFDPKALAAALAKFAEIK